jgi:hypothetical protein
MSNYSTTSEIFSKYKLPLYSDIILIIASGYLMVKKLLDFSISGWLYNNVFLLPLVKLYVVTSVVILLAAIVIKICSLVFKAFPPTKHVAVEPEKISYCLQVMNNEIFNHIEKCNSSDSPNIKKLNEQHSFDVNTRLIAESLAEHVSQSIRTIRSKDLFISLYTFDKQYERLKYELHYKPSRDSVQTKIISLTDKKHSDYECVKCINSPDSTAYVLSKDNYSKCAPKRYKTFKQYMGCKLEIGDIVFGYLNIEFHNHSVFEDEDSMQDFMELNIFPFKLLFEYQYLKSFLIRLESLTTTGEVTESENRC